MLRTNDIVTLRGYPGKTFRVTHINGNMILVVDMGPSFCIAASQVLDSVTSPR